MRIRISCFILLLIILLVPSLSVADQYTLIEDTAMTELSGMTGKLGKGGRYDKYPNVLDYYDDSESGDSYASMVSGVALDIMNKNPRWTFDYENENVEHTNYFGAADDKTSGMNDMVFALCNKRGKYLLAVYNYDNHVLLYVNDRMYSEDEAIIVLQQLCGSYKWVRKKQISFRMKLFTEIQDEGYREYN